MLFFAEWIMFLGPTGFPLGRGIEVDSMEIKGAIGVKISDWLKFDVFNIILLFPPQSFSHVTVGQWDTIYVLF